MGPVLKPFKETEKDSLSYTSILREDGYLFFRDILDVDKILNYKNDFMTLLRKYNLIIPEGSEPVWSGVLPDSETGAAIAMEGSELKSLYEVGQSDEILEIARRIYGDPIHMFPETIPRAQPPEDAAFRTPAHQDIYFYERSLDFITAWTPYMDIDGSIGGLTLAENSHKRDFDKRLFAFGKYEGGRIVPGIPEDRIPNTTWLSSDVNPGDVLIFHCKMIHKALNNKSNKVRLSSDIRYQNGLTHIDWRAKCTVRVNMFYLQKIIRSLAIAEGLSGGALEKVVWESQHGLSTQEDLISIQKRIKNAKIETNDPNVF